MPTVVTRRELFTNGFKLIRRILQVNSRCAGGQVGGQNLGPIWVR
jgi:hypothetical protein